jgi:hypothetical protein
VPLVDVELLGHLLEGEELRAPAPTWNRSSVVNLTSSVMKAPPGTVSFLSPIQLGAREPKRDSGIADPTR